MRVNAEAVQFRTLAAAALHVRKAVGVISVTCFIVQRQRVNISQLLPRDATPKRGTSRRPMSVCPSVRHIRVL